MKILASVPLVILILLVSGCTQLDAYFGTPSVFISRFYEDHECFYACTSNLTIDSNNAFRYHERRGPSFFVSKEYALSQQQMSEINGLYQDSDFFSLNDMYICPDSKVYVETVFFFKNSTGEKNVTVLGRCELPPQLKAINDKLDIMKEYNVTYEGKSVFSYLEGTIIGDALDRIGKVLGS